MANTCHAVSSHLKPDELPCSTFGGRRAEISHHQPRPQAPLLREGAHRCCQPLLSVLGARRSSAGCRSPAYPRDAGLTWHSPLALLAPSLARAQRTSATTAPGTVIMRAGSGQNTWPGSLQGAWNYGCWARSIPFIRAVIAQTSHASHVRVRSHLPLHW